MNDNITISFPLTRKEVELLWLDLEKEEWIKNAKWKKEVLQNYPNNRELQTFEVIKTACMIDLNEEKVARTAEIAYRTFWYRKTNYGIYSDNFCNLINKRKDKVEIVAKTSMLWLLMKWDKNVVMEVVKSKDKRYRDTEQDGIDTLAKMLWLVTGASPYAKTFIKERIQWATDENTSTDSDDWQQSNDESTPKLT